MMHNSEITTTYLLQEESFDADGLATDYAGVTTSARISRIVVRRSRQASSVRLLGNKLRKDGSVAANGFTATLTPQYHPFEWANVWNQMSDELKAGLTDEDRKAIAPRSERHQ